ncbi:hypothetical protein PsYK624_087150 [Phanerochaete sordida]|uniref:Uncharacterized protein n=1 Tax=Phanerochaete sordida TaxID=48140 RepID=A0A9P3LES3_9APHY|nr:hypothetical protein PsYK624_087150 [Phanerochaete sordida]
MAASCTIHGSPIEALIISRPDSNGGPMRQEISSYATTDYCVFARGSHICRHQSTTNYLPSSQNSSPSW